MSWPPASKEQVFIVGVRTRAGIAVLARDTGGRGSSLGGSPEGRAERRNLNTPRIEVIAFLLVGVGMSWRWLLDAAVALTDRCLHRSPLYCLAASAVTDRARGIAARGSWRRLRRRGRGG